MNPFLLAHLLTHYVLTHYLLLALAPAAAARGHHLRLPSEQRARLAPMWKPMWPKPDQTSASWLTGGLSRQQIMLQRLPRASASLGRSAAWAALAGGPPYPPCFRHRLALGLRRDAGPQRLAAAGGGAHGRTAHSPFRAAVAGGAAGGGEEWRVTLPGLVGALRAEFSCQRHWII